MLAMQTSKELFNVKNLFLFNSKNEYIYLKLLVFKYIKIGDKLLLGKNENVQVGISSEQLGQQLGQPH